MYCVYSLKTAELGRSQQQSREIKTNRVLYWFHLCTEKHKKVYKFDNNIHVYNCIVHSVDLVLFFSLIYVQNRLLKYNGNVGRVFIYRCLILSIVLSLFLFFFSLLGKNVKRHPCCVIGVYVQKPMWCF